MVAQAYMRNNELHSAQSYNAMQYINTVELSAIYCFKKKFVFFSFGLLSGWH